MKVVAKAVYDERAEMARFESLDTQRWEYRLRIWTGAAGRELAGEATSPYFSLPTHEWVIQVEAEFSGPPGNYEIYYCCDVEGNYSTAVEVADEAWILLAAGTADSERRFVRRTGRFLEEAEADPFHGQPALFMRFLKVHTANVVTVTAWHVYPDTAVDISDYVEGEIRLSRKTDGKRVGRFVRPTCNFELNPSVTEIAHLKSFARYTLDIRYRGENWEAPRGLMASGWWPVYCGFQHSRRKSRQLNQPTRLAIRTEAGRAMNGLTTQPLLEQITADEFLRDWLTVSDVDGRRLMGVGKLETSNVKLETSYAEFVGKTRMFAGNWWDRILQLSPPERIHGICWTGTHLVALTLDHAAQYENLWHWWLVRFDLGGNELERLDLGVFQRPGTGRPGRREIVGSLYSDLTVWGDSILITMSSTFLEDPEYRGIVRCDRDDWGRGVRGIMTLGQDAWTGEKLFPTAIAPLSTGLLAGGFVVAVETPAPNLSMHVPVGWHLQYFDANGYYAGRWPVFNYPLLADRDNPDNVAMPRFMESYCHADGTFVLIMGGAAEAESGFGTEPARRLLGWIDGEVTSLHVDDPPSLFVARQEASPILTPSYPYSALLRMGDCILAAGFGPQSMQEVAKVARIGYMLENARLRSMKFRGDLIALNYAEPEIRVAGELLTDEQVAIDLDAGHFLFLTMPEDGQEIRASYDYEPSFSLVAIKKQKRWDVAEQVAAAFGLVLRVDAFDRLAWEPREYEELFVARTGGSWVLGSSRTVDGLPWIVADSIEVVSEAGTAIDPALYSRSQTEPAGGGWTLTVVGTIAEQAWIIRFIVQQIMQEIVRDENETCDEEVDADRIITKAVVRGKRRIPAELPISIVQVFAVGPERSDYETAFDRVRPVEGTKSFDWSPTEKIYEQSAVETRPRFNIEFTDPLVLGTSRWGVEVGRRPTLLVISDLTFAAGKRFCRYALTGAESDRYHVWLEHPGTWRLATEEDRADIHGNVVGGDGNDPADNEPIKAIGHFYLKQMNELVLGVNSSAIVYHSEMKYYALDEFGRQVERPNPPSIPPVNGGERFKTGYADKAAAVILRPQDINGVPLFEKNPMETATGLECTLVMEQVILTAEGLRMRLTSEATRTNFVQVEVAGYPVGEAEMFIGIAKTQAGIDLYGEQERALENDFLPNQKWAERIARGLIARRGDEADVIELERPLMLMLTEDEAVRLDGTLGRVAEVTSTLSRGGSRSRVNVEI